MSKKQYESGTRVIVRSNESSSYEVGKIIHYLKMRGDNLPVIEFESSGKKMLCMGIVREYDDKLIKILNTMTSKEQWDFLIE